jgi:hypothetical protein
VLDVVFNDGENSTFFDNNGGLDYHIPVEGGKGVMPGLKVRPGGGGIGYTDLPMCVLLGGGAGRSLGTPPFPMCVSAFGRRGVVCAKQT